MSKNKLVIILSTVSIIALLSLVVGAVYFIREGKEFVGLFPKGERQEDAETGISDESSLEETDTVPRNKKRPKLTREIIEKRITEEDKKNRIPEKAYKTPQGTIERHAVISEKDERPLTEYTTKRIKGERNLPETAIVKEDFIQWQVNLGGSVSGRPVVSGKNIYVGCTDYQMLCLDKETGEMIFQSKTSSQAIGDPYRYKNTIIIAQRNGNISSYDIKTGKRKWNHRIAVSTPKDKLDISISGISVIGGYIYVSKHWGNLYVLRARDGMMLSAPGVPYESRINLPAITFEGNVLFNNVAGELHCFDKSGENHKWTHAIKRGYPIAMKYGDSKIYVANTERELFALDPNSRKILWSIRTKGFAYDSLAYKDFNIYIGAGNLYAVDASRGDIIWEVTPKGNKGFCHGTPVVAGDYIYAAEQNGIVHKIHKEAGTSVEVFHINGEIMNPLVKDGPLIYVSTTGKKLMAIRVE